MALSKLGYNYNAQKDVPDSRDLLTHEVIDLTAAPVNIPVVDLEPMCGPVKDQGKLGACTGFGKAGYREFLYRSFYQYEKDKTVPADKFIASPLYAYYENRVMEGDVKKDAGAQIRTVVKTLNETGVCLEIDEPYIVSNFAKTPSQAAMDNAAKYKSGAYHRVVGGVEDMKSVLRSGYIMVVGFSVYESFESSYTAQTGQMLVPGPKEKCLGGHCVLCIGYDDNREAFKFRNSWSTAWGDEGNFWMGYRIADMPNTISDAWVSHLGPAWKPKPEETPQSNT